MLGSRYVAGGGVSDWGLLRRVAEPRRLLVRARHPARAPCATSPAASSASGARCSRRSTSTSVHADGYGFQIELTYRALRAGFRVKEMPIVFRERQAGLSKMTARIAVEAVWKVPALRLRRGV